ncbi:MAG: hypothetical protein IIU25_05035, partial [Oscillospiraceae bacterium]|nr:hypothetical protein [Oscillospiraceae bacterium]
MNSFKEVYEAVVDYCSKQGVGDMARNLWLTTLEPARLEGNIAVFYCPNDFHKNIIMSNYHKILCEAFEQIVGFPVELKLIVTDDSLSDAESPELDPESFDALHSDLSEAYEGSR